eukprot:scaffold15596_cov72-Skeletonema_dohrnii-CCMP3373.AAC.1
MWGCRPSVRLCHRMWYLSAACCSSASEKRCDDDDAPVLPVTPRFLNCQRFRRCLPLHGEVIIYNASQAETKDAMI